MPAVRDGIVWRGRWPSWDDLPTAQRAEQAIIGMRKTLGCFVNIRAYHAYPQLAYASPLKPELLRKGIDFVIGRGCLLRAASVH